MSDAARAFADIHWVGAMNRAEFESVLDAYAAEQTATLRALVSSMRKALEHRRFWVMSNVHQAQWEKEVDALLADPEGRCQR